MEDYIDVEVQEEVLESDSDTTTYTDEEVQEMLKEMKKQYTEHGYNVDCEDLAYKIGKNSMDYLDNDTYLWTMYMFARKFYKEERDGFYKYCLLRMRQILNAEKGKGKKPEALQFIPNTLPKSVIEEVYSGTIFVEESVKKIKMSFFFMEALVLGVFFIIMYFVMNMSLPISLVCTLGLLIVNYFTTFRTLEERFMREQMKSLYAQCGEEPLRSFDAPVVLS